MTRPGASRPGDGIGEGTGTAAGGAWARRERAGWGLFVLSAVLFSIDALRSGNWVVLAASVVFGAACVLFLLPRGR